MWGGTGCGGFSQAFADMSGPVQDSIGSMIALAEAAGARPIVDAAAATASAPRRNRLMFFRLLITPAFRRVPLRPHQGTKVAFYLAIPCSVPQEHRIHAVGTHGVIAVAQSGDPVDLHRFVPLKLVTCSAR
jgi:hypothetical protein